MDQPSNMPNSEFNSLTPEQRRMWPHPNDVRISIEGKPKLTISYYQAKYNEKEATKSKCNAKNNITMMPNLKNIDWVEDGFFQREIQVEIPTIHLYDWDTWTVATFNKEIDKFITTCQLDRQEHAELIVRHNFSRDKNYEPGKVRNLPPRVLIEFEKSLDRVYFNIVPDVSPVGENLSLGFTITHNFENDVLGITPINNSTSDKT